MAEDVHTGGLTTFLFTDVVGSTAAWEAHPREMGVALARHDALVEGAVVDHRGELVRPRGEGDSRFAVFADPSDALAAATAVVARLAAEPWPEPTPIVVRCAVHTGPADLRAGDWYGSAVNRTARLRSLANPGQVLASEVTVQLARAAGLDGVEVTDLGVHWLKDLAQPERVFQVDLAGSTATFPPLRSLTAGGDRRAPLPTPSTSLVGREAEVAGLATLVTDPSSRIITVTGPGGVGKTRLAVAAAASATAQLPGGTWFVDLAATTDPGLVLGEVATALGAPDRADRSPADAIVELLGDAPSLLVLDNLEQVVAAATELAELARRVPALTVLATSRVPMRVAGEIEHPVEPLAATAAVDLFVARATAHRPSFALTAEVRADVEAVCRRLDGLPLAIELAAARTKVLRPADLLARLDQRLPILVGSDRDAPDRQRTLRATIEWSYDLLDVDQQQLLDRLAVFPESFPLEAAEAVGDPDPAAGAPLVLDVLAELVDSSLVRPVEDSTGLRFRLLQTVREFAAERLAATGATAATADAHATWALERGLVETARIDGQAAPAALVALRAEEPNLRAALLHLTATDPVRAARLALALRAFWIAEGRLTEGRARVAAVVGSPLADDALRGALLVEAGALACYQDDYEAALPLLARGAELARAAGDADALARARCFQGQVALASGEPERGEALAHEALDLAAGADRYEPHVQALALLAMAAGMSGRFDDELAHHQERLALARAHGDGTRVADACTALAEIALDEGDLEAAEAHATEAHAQAKATSRLLVRDASLSLARVAVARGDAASAATHLGEGLALSVEFAQPFELALAVRTAAAAAAVAGRPLAAARLFGAAETIREPGERAFPLEQDLEAVAAQARAHADPAAFDAAWAAGRALAPAAAAELALAEVGELSGEAADGDDASP